MNIVLISSILPTFLTYEIKNGVCDVNFKILDKIYKKKNKNKVNINIQTFLIYVNFFSSSKS